MKPDTLREQKLKLEGVCEFVRWLKTILNMDEWGKIFIGYIKWSRGGKMSSNIRKGKCKECKEEFEYITPHSFRKVNAKVFCDNCVEKRKYKKNRKKLRS